MQQKFRDVCKYIMRSNDYYHHKLHNNYTRAQAKKEHMWNHEVTEAQISTLQAKSHLLLWICLTDVSHRIVLVREGHYMKSILSSSYSSNLAYLFNVNPKVWYYFKLTTWKCVSMVFIIDVREFMAIVLYLIVLIYVKFLA